MRIQLVGRVLKIRIDDDIVDSFWYGVSYREIQDGIDLYAGKFDSVQVVINSAGGSVTEGMAIRSAFQALVAEGIQVAVEVAGVAASISSVIALSGSSLTMNTGSYLMIHRPYTLAVGDYEELRNTADTLEKMNDDLISIYKEKSTLTEEEIKSYITKETWFTASEAQQYGFAETVNVPESGVVLNSSGRKMGNSFMASTFKNIPENLIIPKNQDAVVTETVPVEPQQKGFVKMASLNDYLSKDVEAKQEHDAAILAAKEAGADSVKTALKASAENVKAILNSSVYPQPIKALAIAVASGEASHDRLNDMVALFDSLNAKNESTDAEKTTEETKETPPVEKPTEGEQTPENKGKIDSPEAMKKYLSKKAGA